MGVSYPGDVEILGAHLQGMRVTEVAWEYLTRADGSTYVQDKLNTEYANNTTLANAAENAARDTLVEDVIPSIAAAHEADKVGFEENCLKTYFGDQSKLALSEEVLNEGPIFYEYDDVLEQTGQIAISRRGGVLGALRTDMVTNSQTIRKNVVTLGSLTAVGTVTGTLAESAITYEDHTLTGTFVFTCVDDTVGAVKMDVKLVLTNPLIDGTKEIPADRQLTIGKSFQDGQTGLTILLALSSVSESGDGGAMFSGTTITNPSENESNKGKHYITVERLSGVSGYPDFRITWYKSGDLEDDDVVQHANVTGTSGSVSVVMAGDESTLTFTFDKGAAATALPSVTNTDLDIIFDIKIPRFGEQWTKSSSNDETGVLATKVARRYRASLNSVASGGQTIADSVATSLSMA